MERKNIGKRGRGKEGKGNSVDWETKRKYRGGIKMKRRNKK